MTLVNALLVKVADAVLTPMAGLPPLAVVIGAALATALVVLAVMRLVSNQQALGDVKRRIHASLLEMRLYNDDVRALLRAQGDVLRHNLTYVGLSLVPLVITAVPLTLAIAQLQAWYGYRGLTPGQAVEITATLEPGATTPPRLDAVAVEVVAPARYFPTLNEATWRVVPRASGRAALRLVTANGAVIEKSLDVAGRDAIGRRSPIREQATFVGQLLYPSEPPLAPGEGVAAITVPYPERTLRVVGHDVHWLWVYLVAAFGFVLLLRSPLGVVI